MSVANNSTLGKSPAIQIGHGKVTSNNKQAEVGTVIKLNVPIKLLSAAMENGADDIAFTTKSGEEFIVSGIGFDTLDLQLGNEVTFKGIKGRITWLDNETNSRREILEPRQGITFAGALGGAAVGGVPLLWAGCLDWRAHAVFTLPCLLIGALIGWLNGKTPRTPLNFDSLKRFGEEQ